MGFTDSDGNTPLHILIGAFKRNLTNSVEIAGLLIANGCDPNVLNNDNWTMLHMAARRG